MKKATRPKSTRQEAILSKENLLFCFKRVLSSNIQTAQSLENCDII